MNATQLLASIKRRAYIPDAGASFTDAEILSIADESFIETILPLQLAAREGYLQQDVSGAISSLTNGVAPLPPRCLGGAVSMVRWQDSAGNLYNLSHIDDSQRAQTPQMQTPLSYWTSWYFQGDNICLWPPPPAGIAASGNLIITYLAQPSSLTNTDNGATQWGLITGVTPGSPPSFTTAADTGFGATLSVGVKCDIVGRYAGHDFRVFNAAIATKSGVGPYTWTLDGTTNANNIQVGDYFCVGGVTPIPQCVNELHTLLVLDTARSILDNTKDDRAIVLAREMAEKKLTLNQMITPRGINQKKRIINRNSAYRSTRSTLWGTWGR